MKLKKIASLALAGIMAVSMLTACGESAGNGGNNNDETIVPPADHSLATAVNSDLSAKVKNTLPINAEDNLEAALKAVAEKIATENMNKNKCIVSSDAKDLRHLMGLDDDANLTANSKKTNPKQLDNANQYTDWKYVEHADSTKTTVDLIVYDGDQNQEDQAQKIAEKLEAIINNKRIPNESTVDDGKSAEKTYNYDDTANSVTVKIDKMHGEKDHNLVAMNLVHTTTEAVNVQFQAYL